MRQARVQCEVREGGLRTLIFELSRFLQVDSVTLDGQAVEFIHNPALEGTQLSRRGNDVVAVVLPEPARAGQKIDLEFVYGGEVLAEAGSGLLVCRSTGNLVSEPWDGDGGLRFGVQLSAGLDVGGNGKTDAGFAEGIARTPGTSRHRVGSRSDRFLWQDSTSVSIGK